MQDGGFLTGFHNNPIRDEFLNWWEELKQQPEQCRALREVREPDKLAEDDLVLELHRSLLYYGDYDRAKTGFIGGLSSHVNQKIEGVSFPAQAGREASEGSELQEVFEGILKQETQNEKLYKGLLFVIAELDRTASLLSLVHSVYFWDDRATRGAWKSDFKSALHK